MRLIWPHAIAPFNLSQVSHFIQVDLASSFCKIKTINDVCNVCTSKSIGSLGIEWLIYTVQNFTMVIGGWAILLEVVECLPLITIVSLIRFTENV